MLTPRETLPPRPGCGCRGKAGPLGNFGGYKEVESPAVALESH